MAGLSADTIESMIESMTKDFEAATDPKQKIAISNSIMSLSDQLDKINKASEDLGDDDLVQEQKKKIEGGFEDLMSRLRKFTPIRCQGHEKETVKA